MGLLDVKDLKKEFNGEVLFDNINFTVTTPLFAPIC